MQISLSNNFRIQPFNRSNSTNNIVTVYKELDGVIFGSNSIIMIAHYLQPIIISLCIIIVLFWNRGVVIKKIGFRWWIHIAGYIAIYTTIVCLVFYQELILNMQLQEFDLNKDGIFTGDEVTIDQRSLMRRLAKDTARKFSIYTGLVYSLIITFVLYLIDLVRIRVWNRYIKKTNGYHI